MSDHGDVPRVGPGSGDADDETARLLRRALRREAEMVQPRDDGLERIQERTAEPPGRRWVPWAAAVAAAAVIGLVVGGVIGLSGDDEPAPPAATGTASPTVPPTAPTTSPTQGPTSSPTAEPTGTLSGVPVYWLGESKTSVWLYREFRDVPDVGGPVASAVAAMTREEPLDPDYFTPWRPATSVDVAVDGDAISVDLSADAFAEGVGSEVAERAVQQLVYTATAAAQADGPVTITVDGAPYDAWGVIRVGEPMSRAPMVDVQAPTWILSPSEGQTVPAGTVEVTGYGTAFEANFLWEVRDAASDRVVADGFVTGEGGMGTYGDLTFTVDLEPGEYVIEVYQPDESGGESPEGPRLYPDTKRFTVE